MSDATYHLVDLIASYLARATALGPYSQPDEYVECNRLAYNLALLLPAGLFRTVRDGVEGGDPTSIMQSIIEVRAAIQASGSLDLTDTVHHEPPRLDPLLVN